MTKRLADMGIKMREVKTLWRPIGPVEFELLQENEWKKWPPRLPEQPFFYPVLNEEYATEITSKWNVPQFGKGYVTKFEVEADYISKYPIKQVGDNSHLELWIPAEELEELNKHIVGLISIVSESGDGDGREAPRSSPQVNKAV
jgi:hypothetical protein